MAAYYEYYKIAHICCAFLWLSCITASMAVMFCRNFISADKFIDKNQSEALSLWRMEEFFLVFCASPAMILTIFFGSVMAYYYGLSALGNWFVWKLFLVLVITGMMHGIYGRHAKKLPLSQRKLYIYGSILFFSVLGVVFLVISKP